MLTNFEQTQKYHYVFYSLELYRESRGIQLLMYTLYLISLSSVYTDFANEFIHLRSQYTPRGIPHDSEYITYKIQVDES